MSRRKKIEFDILRIMCENGWTWNHYQDDPYTSEDYTSYTMRFLGDYHTVVRAIVSQFWDDLSCDGHYGVLWLEAADYECEKPYSDGDLKDMLYALEIAEKNLLKIGMPFTPDYRFLADKANKKRRNDKLRRMYNLEQKEKEDNEKRK